MKIAVIDDDRLMLRLVKHSLEIYGHTVFITDSVNYLGQHIQEKQIDLIISDVMMPNVENLSFLNYFKNMGYKKVPVILISSLSEGILLKKMNEYGLSDFLHKPFTNEQLIKKIQYFELKNGL